VYAKTASGEFYNLLHDPNQPLLVVGEESGLKELSARARSGKRRKAKASREEGRGLKPEA
jgi:hypothetical protein